MESFNVETLSPEMKLWFATAIAGMITADGAVTNTEVAFLRDVVNFLDNRDDINNIVGMVKKRESPGLQNVNVDGPTAGRIMFHIAEIAMTDGSLSQKEVDFFKYIGRKISVGEPFCKKVISWAADYCKLMNRKNEILRKT
ncbi:MAG: hypothetical protein GY866_30280 [Proteobacteria bacterium]|nr:hypothetical protein [Pseudomonadota bacterium]